MRCLLTALWPALALLAWAGDAAAFSDPTRFAMPFRAAAGDPNQTPSLDEDGGGDGRWFTGSASDSYTCEVCHSGGQATDMVLRMDPLVGDPAGTMEIILSWAAPPGPPPLLAGNFEVTDDRGLPAGAMRLPDDPTPQDQCGGFPAGSLFEATPQRPVLGYLACGATRFRFLWTPPVGQSGPFWLSGAMVHSDDQTDSDGDGVTKVSAAILRGASEQYEEQLSAGCGALGRGPTGRGVGLPGGLLLAWFGLCVLRRRSHPGRSKT